MIQPNDFLNQANRLVGSNAPEVDLRTSISRAYYSLYHEALIHLKNHPSRVLQNAIARQIASRGEIPDMNKISAWDETYLKRVTMHRAIKDAVLALDPSEGLKYDAFKDSRVDADYKLNLSFKYNDVSQLVNQIAKFITIVKGL